MNLLRINNAAHPISVRFYSDAEAGHGNHLANRHSLRIRAEHVSGFGSGGLDNAVLYAGPGK